MAVVLAVFAGLLIWLPGAGRHAISVLWVELRLADWLAEVPSVDAVSCVLLEVVQPRRCDAALFAVVLVVGRVRFTRGAASLLTCERVDGAAGAALDADASPRGVSVRAVSVAAMSSGSMVRRRLRRLLSVELSGWNREVSKLVSGAVVDEYDSSEGGVAARERASSASVGGTGIWLIEGRSTWPRGVRLATREAGSLLGAEADDCRSRSGATRVFEGSRGSFSGASPLALSVGAAL